MLDSYPVIEMAKVARVEAAMEITCPGNSAPVKQACIFKTLKQMNKVGNNLQTET